MTGGLHSQSAHLALSKPLPATAPHLRPANTAYFSVHSSWFHPRDFFFCPFFPFSNFEYFSSILQHSSPYKHKELTGTRSKVLLR